MRRQLFTFLLMFFLFFVFGEKMGGDYSVANAQGGRAIQSWEEYIKDYPYIYLEDAHEIKLNDDWSVDEYYHYRIRIQKDSAKEQGEQKIYYMKSREDIYDIQAHVETPDGEKHPATRIQDLAAYEGDPMYSDSRVKIITLPQVNVGSIIDVKIKSKMQHDVIRNQFSFNEYYPSKPHKHYQKVLIFPKDKNISFKKYRTVAPPVKKEEDGNVVYTFEYNETVPLDETESFPPPYVELFGVSSFSSMTSWEVIEDWYRDLVKKNMIESEDIKQKTLEIIKGKESEPEKVRAVLEFLQDEFRYVSMSFGDHTVEPHPTDQIFKNRYGDCKDWSILTKQMLGLAGVKSNICLFNDEYAGDPEWGLPCVTAFDHVILEVIIDGVSYFLDPQLKNFNFGQIPNDYNHAFLFIIDEESSRFSTMPLQKEKDYQTRIKVIAELRDKGSVDYEVKAKLGVELSNGLRQYWDALPKEGKDLIFEMIESRFARGGSVINPIIKGIDNRYGQVMLTFDVKAHHIYQVVNDMMIISEPINQYFPSPFVDNNRAYPLFLPYSDSNEILIIYQIPTQYKVDFLPENFKLESDVVSLERKIKHEKGQVLVRYDFNLKRGRVPIERYRKMKRVWEQFYEKSSQCIILKKVK